MADLKDVAATGAAELVVNQLVTIVPKRLEVLLQLRFRGEMLRGRRIW